MEILTPEQAKLQPMFRLDPPPKLRFELRLVIWETYKIPPGDWVGDMSDMYVRAWMPAGSGEGSGEQQDTDTHWRAKKGRGSFNWRMKFNVDLPLEPPRDKIYLQVWDSDPLNPLKRADLRGEKIVSIKKLVRKAFYTEMLKQNAVEKDAASETTDQAKQSLQRRNKNKEADPGKEKVAAEEKNSNKSEDKKQKQKGKEQFENEDKEKARESCYQRCSCLRSMMRMPLPKDA